MTKTTSPIFTLMLVVSAHSRSIGDVHNCNFTAMVWDEDTAETEYTTKVIGSSKNWIITESDFVTADIRSQDACTAYGVLFSNNSLINT